MDTLCVCVCIIDSIKEIRVEGDRTNKTHKLRSRKERSWEGEVPATHTHTINNKIRGHKQKGTTFIDLLILSFPSYFFFILFLSSFLSTNKRVEQNLPLQYLSLYSF